LENILSLQECRFLVALYDQYSELASSRDYNCRPLLDYYTLRDVDNKSATWVYGVTLRCKAKIEVDLSTPQLFVESFYVACISSGDSHIPHADNERRENRRWVPNHTPQRDYTGLAYLNDDFTGGELVFPDLDVVIAPKPGLLVGFPSNHKFCARSSEGSFRETVFSTDLVYCEFDRSHAGLIYLNNNGKKSRRRRKLV